MTRLTVNMHSATWTMVCISAGLLAAASLGAAEHRFDVRDYGARPNGKTLSTAAIQKAIDACAAAGGGTVYLPPGTLRSGTLRLKSHVGLWLEAGSILLGSERLDDYPRIISAVRSYTDVYVDRSLIAGENLEDVAIGGRGTIDGNGGKFHWPQYLNRPYVIRLVACRGVRVEGVTLRNSAMWMQHYLACDHVAIRGITVFNHATYNDDGVDIDGCHDVFIADSLFDSDDDGITLKSTLDRACENVVITNCLASSHCNAIKLGTESNGGFKNIAVSNCTISSPRSTSALYGANRGSGGIALEVVDGGTLDGVAISNVLITGINCPLFLRLGDRARPFREGGPRPPVGSFRNVMISNVIATGMSRSGCSITGLPGHCLENVWLDNVSLSFEGGGTQAQASRPVPELAGHYPDPTMFGTLPAYGLFCRHVQGLKLNRLRLRTTAADGRGALVCHDVQGLSLDGLDAGGGPGAAAVVRLNDVREAMVRGCTLPNQADTFLEVRGAASRRIALWDNDLRRARRVLRTAAEVPEGAVSDRGTRPRPDPRNPE
jgi:hypothetical protein